MDLEQDEDNPVSERSMKEKLSLLLESLLSGLDQKK